MLFWRVNVKIVRSERNAVEIRNFFRKKATLQPCMNRGKYRFFMKQLFVYFFYLQTWRPANSWR